MSEVKFKLAAGTNVGLVRTNNEDNFIVCPDLSTSTWLIPQDSNFAELGDLGAMLVVADGMGGANAGEVASAICVDTIQRMFTPDRLVSIVADEKAVQQFMGDVVRTADLNIKKHGRQNKSTKGMGTTVVMAWILGRRAYICWCGDSRCYVYNRKRGLMQLSKDHSYVQELVDGGVLRPELASEHPLSNVITRCLGDVEKRANPDTRVYELYSGDTIMLCSDGLSGFCSDEFIAQIIAARGQMPMECRNALIEAALQGGGADNVTVALCTVALDGEEVEETAEVEMPVLHSRDGLNATLIPVPIPNADEEEENVTDEEQTGAEPAETETSDTLPEESEEVIEEKENTGSTEEPSEIEEPSEEEAEAPVAVETENPVEADALADMPSEDEEASADSDAETEAPVTEEETVEESDKAEDEIEDKAEDEEEEMTEDKEDNSEDKAEEKGEEETTKEKTADDEKDEKEKKQKDEKEGKEKKEKSGHKPFWTKVILWTLLFVVVMAVIYICVMPECQPIRDYCSKTYQSIINSLRRS